MLGNLTKAGIALAVLLLAACGAPQQKPTTTVRSEHPTCDSLNRVGSTNELAPQLSHEGKVSRPLPDVKCWDGDVLKTLGNRREWVDPPNGRVVMSDAAVAKLADPPATTLAKVVAAPVAPEQKYLYPMTKHEKRAWLNNTAGLEAFARIFEQNHKDYLLVDAGLLVQNYEQATGAVLGGNGKGFAAVLRSESARFEACTSKFLKEHDLGGWIDNGHGTEIRNVTSYTDLPRRTCDPGERVLFVNDVPIAMTGCLNPVLKPGQLTADDRADAKKKPAKPKS